MLRVKRKIIIAIIIIMFTMYLTNDYGIIDIKKTALVVGLGVDIDENDEDKYLVSAQIAIPSATDSKRFDQEAVISGKGRTVAEAVKDLSTLTGWYPKLKFCNLIIINEKVFEKNSIACLDFFLRSHSIQDSTLLIASKDKAFDVLNASSPLDEISAFAIEKILSRDNENSSKIGITTLKNFLIGYYNFTNSGQIGLLSLIDSTDTSYDANGEGSLELFPKQSQKNNSQQSQGGQSGSQKNQSGNQNNSTTDRKILFVINRSLLIKGGKKVGSIDLDKVLMLNIIKGNFSKTSYNITDVNINDGSEDVLLRLVKSDCKSKLTFENNQPKFKVDLRLTARFEDQQQASDLSELEEGAKLPSALIDRANEQIRQEIINLFNLSKETGCDVFCLKERLYERFPDKFLSRHENLLNETVIEVKVSLRGKL